MAGLLELLLGGGHNPPLRLGGEDTPAGGGLLDAVGRRIMQQQLNPYMGGGAPVNAPQQAAEAPQGAMAAPQVSMPQQGGGGLLGRLFGGGQRGGSNSTVQWLINKGYDPGAAQAIASDPQTLRAAMMQVGSPQGASEYDQRAAAARQYGIDPNSEEGRNFILGGKLGGDEELPSSAKEYEYAVRKGYKGSYTDWQTKGVRDQDKGFGNEKDLAAQYSSDPNVKEYSIVRNNYERIREGAQLGSGAGDIAVIFGYMKMLDPTSVVRENEQATAENAGGVPANVRNLYNKLMTGDKLAPEVRQMYVESAAKLYEQVSNNVKDVNARFGTRAGAWGVDPNHFMVNPEVYDPLNVTLPTPPPLPQPTAPVPGPQTGGRKTKSGVQWSPE